MGKRPKLKLPVLKVAISGRSSGSTAALSSSVIPFPPPVVGCTITSQRSLMPPTTSRKSSSDELGLPVSGSRTWMCTIAAPASWAPTAESMISSGVMGIAGLCPGTVMPPVIAALMMTFSMLHPFCISSPSENVKDRTRPPQTPQPTRDRRARNAILPPGARIERSTHHDRRGPHRLSPFPEGRPQLPPRPGAAGGRGRHPRGGTLVGQRLESAAVGDRGDPGPGEAREALSGGGLRASSGGRSSGHRGRDGGGAGHAGDLRRGAPRRKDDAGRPGARGGLVGGLDRRGWQEGGEGDPRHPRGSYGAHCDLPGLPGRGSPTPAGRTGAQAPLRDRARGALQLVAAWQSAPRPYPPPRSSGSG